MANGRNEKKTHLSQEAGKGALERWEERPGVFGETTECSHRQGGKGAWLVLQQRMCRPWVPP